MMNDQTLDALSEFLSDGNRFAKSRDSVLDDAGFLEAFTEKPKCEECGADIADTVESDVEGMELFVCKNRHEFHLPAGGDVRYKLLGERVLEAVCDVIGLETTTLATHYPEYVIAETEQDVRIALVCDGARYERVLDRLFVDAIKENRVNALLIPDSFDGTAYETAMKYPLGPLAPTFPLSMLTNPDAVTETIDGARMSLARSEYALREGGWGDSDLLRSLEQNPRLIESELYYCRVFRETGYSGQLGDRLEDVSKAAFSTMDFALEPEVGGAEDRFENVTDIAFIMPPSTRLAEDGERILGVVDTKSGSDTHLNSEEIEKKHANYLRQASAPVFDGMQIAHIFVVFSMKGREANEIDWYDGIEKKYRGENDATMVVLYADALAQMVNAHLSMAQRNELNTSIGGGILDAFRPFFNFRLFKRQLGSEIQNTTRFGGEDLSETEEDYQREYFKRERLLVVTKEMVDDRIYEVADNEEIASILSQYPSDGW